MTVSAPKYFATSKLNGTAPWYVGCFATTDGNYEVLWQVIGPASKVFGNSKQPGEAKFYFPDPGNNNIIRLTIINLSSGSDAPFCMDYPVIVTKNPNAGVISNFTIRKAALRVGETAGFTLETTVMLPCIKWDYDDSSVECSHDENPNHTYLSPKIINGQVTVYMVPSSGKCDCTGIPVGSKEFSLLIYQS